MNRLFALGLVLMSLITLLPDPSLCQPIPNVAAEAAAIRRREKIKYKEPQQAVIEVMPNARDEKKTKGTLLQPLKEKQPQAKQQNVAIPEQKSR